MNDIHSEYVKQVHSGVPAELFDASEITQFIFQIGTSDGNLREGVVNLTDETVEMRL